MPAWRWDWLCFFPRDVWPSAGASLCYQYCGGLSAGLGHGQAAGSALFARKETLGETSSRAEGNKINAGRLVPACWGQGEALSP